MINGYSNANLRSGRNGIDFQNITQILGTPGTTQTSNDLEEFMGRFSGTSWVDLGFVRHPVASMFGYVGRPAAGWNASPPAVTRVFITITPAGGAAGPRQFLTPAVVAGLAGTEQILLDIEISIKNWQPVPPIPELNELLGDTAIVLIVRELGIHVANIVAMMDTAGLPSDFSTGNALTLDAARLAALQAFANAWQGYWSNVQNWNGGMNEPVPANPDTMMLADVFRSQGRFRDFYKAAHDRVSGDAVLNKKFYRTSDPIPGRIVQILPMLSAPEGDVQLVKDTTLSRIIRTARSLVITTAAVAGVQSPTNVDLIAAYPELDWPPDKVWATNPNFGTGNNLLSPNLVNNFWW